MIDRNAAYDAPELATTALNFNSVALSTRIMPAGSAARGGDWCETFVLSDDVVALSIGDVCGHGIGGFETMAATRQAVRDAASRALTPAQTLAEANRFLRGYDPRTYATAAFALLDTGRRTLTLANAGHPPPLMVSPYGATFLEYPENDVPLGIDAAFVPPLRVISLPAQTLLVFYTDGVTEHKRDPLRGAAQLRQAAMFAYRHAARPTASVIERRMRLSGSNQDDASILTVWMPPAPPDRTMYSDKQIRDGPLTEAEVRSAGRLQMKLERDLKTMSLS